MGGNSLWVGINCGWALIVGGHVWFGLCGWECFDRGAR